MIKKDQNHLVDSGRSMVEMLGVLAIMAVLAVAAIFGFSYAMAKLHANNIVNDIKYLAQELNGAPPPTLPATLKSLADDYQARIQNKSVIIYSNSVDEKTCQTLLKQKLDYVAYIGTKDETPCGGPDNQVAFYMEYPKTCSTKTDCKQECATCLAGLCKVGTYNEKNECVECMTNDDCPQGYWCQKNGAYIDSTTGIINRNKCVSLSSSVKFPFGLIRSPNLISFEDAKNFCQAADGYLPTESEWKSIYAAITIQECGGKWTNVGDLYTQEYNGYYMHRKGQHETTNGHKRAYCLVGAQSNTCPTDTVMSPNDVCVDCNTDADCKNEAKPYCSPHNTCVACLTDEHCPKNTYCSTNTDANCQPSSSGCIAKGGLTKYTVNGKIWYRSGGYYTWYKTVALCKAYGGRIPSMAEYGIQKQEDGTYLCQEGMPCRNLFGCPVSDPATTTCRAVYVYKKDGKDLTTWNDFMVYNNQYRANTGSHAPTAACCVVD